MTAAAQAAALLGLVAASALFVAAELALSRLRAGEVERFGPGRPSAAALRHALEHLDSYLAVCRFGATVSAVGLGFSASALLARELEPLAVAGDGGLYAVSFAAAAGVVVLLHVLLGTVVPRSAAADRTARIALAVAVPLRVFHAAAHPLVDVLDRLARLLLRPFRIPLAHGLRLAPPTEAELRELLRESRSVGLIEQSDLDLAERAFAFGDRDVQDIMVPRPEIVALSLRRPAAESLATAVASPYTRYPVYRDSLDDLAGMVHARDLLSALHDHGDEELRLEPLVRPALVVPETKLLTELLADFRRRRQHLAIVVDEYGAVVGLVTFEDLVEEIVGEIEDEYDVAEEQIERTGGRRARVDGTLPIEEFNAAFGEVLSTQQFHTLGGFVFGLLGRRPEPGDECAWNGIRFRVLDVAGPRIERLEIELPEAT